jgi:ATP-dependent Lon protease
MRPNRIPVFPLDIVLFPAMTLPLHIFEPRYKIMIARCLNERLEFGIVFAEGKSVAGTGCTAEIVRKIKDYPDGRMDILTEGRAVFRITDILEEKEYYEGIVEYLVDAESPRDERLESRLIEAFQQCHAELYGQPWSAHPPANHPELAAGAIAYMLAPLLPLELRERQSLLEMRAEQARQDFLLHWLADSLPKLRERSRARHRAGGNGHRPVGNGHRPK